MITKDFVKNFLLLLLLLILILNNININTIYNENFLNCPIDYNDNLQQLIQKSKNNLLRGYTKNDYLYKMEKIKKMENIKMNDPLPINSNFFYNQY